MSQNIQGGSVEGHIIIKTLALICRPGFELIKKVEFYFASKVHVLVDLFEVNARVIMKDEHIQAKNS